MISALQHRLNDLYRAAAGYDIRDFLITDPALAAYMAQGAMLTNSRETLLLAQDDEGLAVSLFLDGGMLERLEESRPLDRLRAAHLDDLWQVLEGVSHFNYVVHRAVEDRGVSLFELELQAEIDKFVSTVRLAVDQDRGDILDKLHGWLFEEVRYHEGLDPEQLDRYQTANDYAGRFCARLRDRLLDDDDQALSELRQFYRYPLTEKISHIHSSAWDG